MAAPGNLQAKMPARRPAREAADLGQCSQHRLLFTQHDFLSTPGDGYRALQIDPQGDIVVAVGNELRGSPCAATAGDASANSQARECVERQVAEELGVAERFNVHANRLPTEQLAPIRNPIVGAQIVGRKVENSRTGALHGTNDLSGVWAKPYL